MILEFIALVGTALFYWPNPRPRADYDKSRWQQVREIDWIGIFFFTGGSTTFVIGLTWGGSTAHPWKSAGTIAPILIGFFVTLGALVYDNIMAKTPTFPFLLFRLVRKFTLVVVVIFIATMVFNSVTPLLPQGSLYMFTNSGIKIGVYSLPNGVMSLIVGVVGPILAHKIGSIKWQLCFGLLLLATFTAATAAAVDPNRLQLWIWLPAFGPPMFVYINLLCYNIVSLHVPHSRLGVAIGLLGTIRSVGGSVGNAIFNTVFQDRFTAYVGGEVVPVALEHGLSASDLPKVIPGVIEYNLGNPHALDGISGITPVVASALRVAVRTAYGRAFRIVFLSTLAPTIVGLICGCLVEDPTPFMTNHIQSAMLATLEHAHDDERDPEQDLKRTDEITEEHLGLQGEAT